MQFLNLLHYIVTTTYVVVHQAREIIAGFSKWGRKTPPKLLPHPRYFEPLKEPAMSVLDKLLEAKATPVVDPKEEVQRQTETLFHKNQMMKRIREVFMNAETDFLGIMKAAQYPVEFGFALLAQMTLHKRANLPTLVGILRHHVEQKNCQLTADLLVKAVELDLVDFDIQTEIFIIVHDIPEAVQDELDAYQFPLPMIIPPKPVTHNKETGYLTHKGSIILQDNHHEGDVNLEHINRMNSIPLSIELRTTSMVKNKWKGLDRQDSDETREEYLQRIRTFNKYNRTAHLVHGYIESAGEGICYLTHKYDKRGRVYCVGFHVNPQGNQWNKGALLFANKELLE